MAASINLGAYSDALVVLGTAGIVVPLVRLSGLNPVIGYLAAGAFLGPLGLGAFATDVPLLRWVTITDAGNVAGIADLGIVFLLFLVGIELSFARLMTMRRAVFGLGSLQIIVSALLLAAILHRFGQSASAAAILGACLALSSTAIVIELLSGQGRLASSSGRASFAILLAQDLAVVPLLFLIPVLGAGATGSLAEGLAVAFAQAAAAIAVIIVFGRLALRPLFRVVAHTKSNELFTAATLFVIVLTGVVAAQAGMSMALGAFVAGLLLAETEYRKAIEAIVQPFKGLLLGIFFFTIGMGIDFRAIMREPLLLVGSVIGLILLKAAVTYALCRLFRVPKHAALETAFLLGPGGEFAFVGIGVAVAVGAVGQQEASFALVVTALSMALIPALGAFVRRLERRWAPPKPLDTELLARPGELKGHAIIVGHGRVGKVVCAMLKRHKKPYLATDLDAAAVAADRRAGHDVYYGNASDAAFLAQCGLRDASAIIITVHTQLSIDQVVRLVRAERPDIPIVSRARDADHARRLYQIGVTDAVPETIEASLQLSEAALVSLRVPMGKVIASIHEKRDEFRDEIRDAAAPVGRDGAHAIKAKTTG